MKNVKFPIYVQLIEKTELNLRSLNLETAAFLYCLWLVTNGRRTLIPANRKLSPCNYADKLLFNRIIRSNLVSLEKDKLNVLKIYSPENCKKEMELLFGSEDYPCNWRENFVNFWKECALYECVNYLEYLFSNIICDFSIGEKSSSIEGIKTAIEYYPIEKIYNILWIIKNDVVDLCEKNKKSINRHDANRAICTIESKVYEFYGNKRKFKPFEFKSFSVLTEVVFCKMLKVGAAGFSEIPSEAKLFSMAP